MPGSGGGLAGAATGRLMVSLCHGATFGDIPRGHVTDRDAPSEVRVEGSKSSVVAEDPGCRAVEWLLASSLVPRPPVALRETSPRLSA